MKYLVPILCAALLSGCGASRPTLAGGKPVSYWAEALRAPDPKLRKQAAFKLGNVGAADAAVLPALTAALKDPDAAVRCEAILALAKCGAAAQEALPALEKVRQSDASPAAREYAARALEKLRAGQ